MLANIIVWLVVDLLLLVTFIYMPVLRRDDAFFGVRISASDYRGAARKLLQRYWFWLVMTFVEIEIIGLLVSLFRAQLPWARISAVAIFVPAATLLYIIFARQAKQFEISETSQRFASGLKVRHLRDYTNIGLEIGNLVLIIIPMLLLVYFYPMLPERIPIHWDWRGIPDGWARKSFFSVFLLPFGAIYLQGLMLLFKHGMLETKMTLPAEHTEQYRQGKEEMLTTTLWLLDWVRILESNIVFTLTFMMVVGALGYQHYIGWLGGWIAVSSVLLVAICGYCIYQMYTIDRRLKDLVGRVYVQRKTDASRWYYGGLFYYNPDDPALFVEKLVGLGYTLNMGNKRVYLYLAYLAILPLCSLFIETIK